MEMAEGVSALSRLLVHWIQNGYLPRFGPVDQITVPEVTQFLLHLEGGFNCPFEVFIVATKYLLRLHTHTQQDINFRHAFLAALSLGHKFLIDDQPDRKYHAYVGGITAPDLAKLENSFLETVQYRLFVSEASYLELLSKIEKEIERGRAPVADTGVAATPMSSLLHPLFTFPAEPSIPSRFDPYPPTPAYTCPYQPQYPAPCDENHLIRPTTFFDPLNYCSGMFPEQTQNQLAYVLLQQHHRLRQQQHQKRQQNVYLNHIYGHSVHSSPSCSQQANAAAYPYQPAHAAYPYPQPQPQLPHTQSLPQSSAFQWTAMINPSVVDFSSWNTVLYSGRC